MSAGKAYIGTSGWNYKHWGGPFYPADLPQKKWLEYYSESFNTVEINNSFYRLPEETTFEKWRDTVSENFIFAVKASRYITHMKKLKEPVKSLENFMKNLQGLREKTGPILFQLPGTWPLNLERLQSFLTALPSGYRYTFEFRHASWFSDDIYQALSRHKVALCFYNLRGKNTPMPITADFIYVRMHGPGEKAYQGHYGAETLLSLAKDITAWTKERMDVYCYFNNDEKGYAVRDAMQLRELITG